MTMSTPLRTLAADQVNQIVFVTVAVLVAVACSVGFGMATGWLLMSQTYTIVAHLLRTNVTRRQMRSSTSH